MKIKLDENFRLESTELQWTLIYEKSGEISEKTGKPTLTKREYYHPTLVSAIRSYSDKKLKNGEDIGSIEELIKVLEGSMEQLKKILKKI